MLTPAHRPARIYLAALAAATLLCVFASVGMVEGMLSVTHAAHATHHSATIIAATNDAIADLQDLEAAQDAYLRDADPRDLDTFEQGRVEFRRALGKLFILAGNDEWQRQQILLIRASAAKRLDSAAAGLAMRRHGRALARLPSLEPLRLEVRALRDRQLQLNDEIAATARRERDRAILITAIAAGFMVAAGSIAIAILRRFRARVAREAARIDRRFEATFEEAAVGIAHVAPDGRWLRVNGQFSALTGYSHEELLAGSFQQITHPDDLLQDLQHVEELLAGRATRYAMEKRYIRKDGSIIWVNLTVALIRDAAGQPDFFVSVIQDITDRRRLDADLQASEARYRVIFDTAGEAIAVTDRHGVIRSVNPVVQQVFGHAPEALIGQHIGMLMAPGAVGTLDFARAGQGSSDQAGGVGRDMAWLRKDGSAVAIDLSIAEWQFEGETFFTAIMRDVTERHLAEKALRSSEERLGALQNEYAHLARVNEMGEMAAAIAHEINQPLTAIVNNLNAGLYATAEGYSPEAFAEAEEVMSEAAGQALRAGEIVRRLRDFIGKSAGERRTESLDKLVESAARLALIDAAANGIHVERIAGAGDARVQVDPVQIQQVIVNLVRNATEALVTLPAHTERRLTIATRALDGVPAVEIRIADTGPGIAPQVRAKLFEPFVTSKKHGMGIGLSVCRRLMESHGGSIALEETEIGTEFRLVLPRDARV